LTLEARRKKRGQGSSAARPLENQAQESAVVCWQLQKLVPPSKKWQDCNASELDTGGRVCLDKQSKRIKYRMHKGKPGLSNGPSIFENQTQE
jgi:hypothetical protein